MIESVRKIEELLAEGVITNAKNFIAGLRLPYLP